MGARASFLSDELLKLYGTTAAEILSNMQSLPVPPFDCGHHSEATPPVICDKALVNAVEGGHQAFAESLDRVCFGGRGATAKSPTGVTVLMRVCRNIGVRSRDTGTYNLEELINRNADPLLCCDSGRNCLHDLFWGSNSLTSNDSSEALHMLTAVRLLLSAYGPATMLTLL